MARGQPERSTVREWRPDGRTITAMNLAGLAMLAVGLVGYAAIWSAASGATGASITAWDLMIAVAATIVLMAAHEGVHGMAIAALGGRPVYGATMIGKALPAFYCTSHGTRFTRAQYLTITLAPAMVLGIGAAVVIAVLPESGWLVAPAAVHLAGCVGDFTMALIVARLPPGSLVEDLASGMRLHLPAPDPAQAT